MAHDPPGVTRAHDLSERLRAAWALRGPDHEPRTRLREADGSARYVNRLIEEASPYLVQHAHNPVDWRPWGEAAFAEAAERDVPVLLSVGYATCHWCHVMEEESFDDEDVAAIVNTHFVPVKLDREQRPDLDHTYITATQIQQGHAGWPNTVFLRPDGAPFHTGTYFPKLQFVQLLAAVAQAWREQRGEIDTVAGRMTDAIRRMQTLSRPGAGLPGEATAAAAVEELAGMHNAERGGFSDGQQFPQESFLLLLIDRWRRDGETRALEMAARTLDAIAAGGIHDHVGGGFHRYATDPDWRTPHFEKMLYNQAQIARAMVDGWQATGRAAWRRAAERCFDYVLRDMTDAEGAFFAAEDADSPDREGRQEEGAFYAWTPEEVRAALGPDAGEAIATLGLDRPPTVGAGAVPHLTPGAPVDADRLDPLLDRLRAARDARPRPFRDEKVIAGWNGLMIRALADGAVAFSRPDLAAAAARAGETLWARHRDGERLFRLRAGGRAMERAMLEDHAWLGLAFLALDAATGEAVWLDRAETLAAAMRRDFADPSGRMRMAAEDGPLGPIHESADGATPAGESSALEFLARLAAATGDAETRLAARSLTAAIAGSMTEVPVLRPDALMAVRLLEEGDAGPSRVLAGGALRLHLRRQGAGLALDVAPAAGWHLTAPEPGAADLVGAEAEGARVGWPDGTERDLGGAGGAVRVLDGGFSATVAPVPGAETLALRLQPCSDALCAEPVRTEFRLPVDLRAGGGP